MTKTGLYLITDPQLLPGSRLFAAVETVLATGEVAMLQYRNKTATWSQKYPEARELWSLCQQANTPLIINDDLELALKLDGVGVHLGQQDGDLNEARRQLGTRLLGCTCHGSLALAEQAVTQGADYLAFGRFFPSTTKTTAPAAAMTILTQAKQHWPQLARVAIGGVTLAHAESLLHAGATHLAVVADVFGQAELSQMATQVAAYGALFRRYFP
jgi:thiamine-phosphate pyrophosphorylase